MCIEDIRLGRKRYSAPKLVASPGATLTPLVGAAANRVALLISGNGTTNSAVGPANLGILDTQGFILPNAAPMYLFRIEDLGHVITEAWNCFTAVPGSVLAVIEVFLDEK